MNGHVFQCPSETNDRNQYTRTFEELVRYAKKELRSGRDIAHVLRNEVDPTITEPPDIPNNASLGQQYKYKAKMEAALKRQELLNENKGAMYSVILGQCSVLMENELKSHPMYEVIDVDQTDCVELLGMIRNVIYKYSSSKQHPYAALLEAKISCLCIKQEPGELVLAYRERFDAAIKGVDFHGGVIGNDFALLAHELNLKGHDSTILYRTRTAQDDKLVAEALVTATERMKVFIFLRGADSARYQQLQTALQNNYLHGSDQYPSTMTKAFDLLLHYKPLKTSNNHQGYKENKKKHGNGSSNGGNGGARSGEHRSNQNSRTHNVDETNETRQDSNTTESTQGNFLLVGNREDTTQYSSVPIDYGELDNSELGFLQYSYNVLLAQAKQMSIPSSWIIIDSASTVSIIRLANLLTNIRGIPVNGKPLELHTNGGVQLTKKVGNLRGFGTVWYNPKSLANILSLAHVRRMFRVTYDSAQASSFFIHRNDGSTIEFKEFRNGLYFYDTAVDKSKDTVMDYCFIDTVAENKSKFSRRECDQADLAKKVHALTGRQPFPELTRYIRKGKLKNCPVNHEDMQRSRIIYGPAIPSLKGGTVRRQPMHVNEFTPTPLPGSVMQYHKRVTLCVDVVYIHKLPFLHTISRKLMFRTQQALDDRNHDTIVQGLKLVIQMYQSRGFIISTICADNEFRGITADFPGITINACGADEHVPEIERSNRTIKERIRATTHSLPFRYYPKTLIRGIVLHAVSWLNAFPNKHGICPDLSPREIVTGRETDFLLDCRVELGTFCQITEHNEPTNSLDARTRDAIALHPTGNRQGSYFFMTLDTWERVSQNQWQELPMPSSIISHINNRGRQEGRRAVKKVNTFTYEWRPRKPMFADEPDDDGDDDDYTPPILDEGSDSEPDEEVSDCDSDEDDSDTSDDEDSANTGSVDASTHTDEENEHEESESEDDTNATVANGTSKPDTNIEDIANVNHTSSNDNSNNAINKSIGKNSEDNTKSKSSPTFNPDELFQQRGYNLRKRQKVSYNNLMHSQQHAFLQLAENPTIDCQQTVVSSIVHHLFLQNDVDLTDLQQYGEKDINNNNEELPIAPPPSIGYTDVPYKKGIEIFGERAIKAIIKEVAQLNDKSVFHAIDATQLSHEEKRSALRALTFVKQKRCGKIKARTCADGRGQRKFYDKADSASPTVSIEGLLLTLAIDAIEGRDVATADIAGAYLNAEMDDFVLLKFDGDMVNYVLENNPEYHDKVVYEYGKKTLYMQLDKALYGCLKSAILWYNMFSGFLKENGFEINPYDLCVANKEINGKQCTICWYVDDLKISHVDSKVVDEVIKQIEDRFTKMNVMRGRKHVYVGCNIEFLQNGEVSIDNIDYLKECIHAFGEDVSSHVNTPAGRNLFTPKSGSPTLNKVKSEKFQSITMKLLWIAKRSRPDLETTLSYLCTRTHKSTEDDWKKLRRLLQFVNKTINDKRIISASALGKLSMWVDASYAVHEDMKSHTGATISIGKGTTYCSSSKQKLNVKSSTEGELVGCSDKVPQGIWSRNFLEAQGYNIGEFNLGQDNTSAMLLEENGIMSAGQKSRHIHIRYFFIKDRIENDRITLVHCPTEIMLADYFTKPLQGNLFQKMRNVIMGYCDVNELSVSKTKECVGKSELPQNTSDRLATNLTGIKESVTWSDVVRGTHKQKQNKEDRRSKNKASCGLSHSFETIPTSNQ